MGEPGHNFLNHGKALVAGWGKTDNYTADKTVDIVSTPKLQKLEVPVISQQRCNQRFNNIILEDLRYKTTDSYLISSHTLNFSMEAHLCAGGEARKDSCNVSKIS